MAQLLDPPKGWRAYLASWVWPWVALAWVIPFFLMVSLARVFGPHWAWWFLFAAWAIAPPAIWWVRGRGREPGVGFFAVYWSMTVIYATLKLRGVMVPESAAQLSVVLLAVTYWPWWAWFYKLRHLPSTSHEAADKLSIGIFLITGTPGIAVSLGGLDAVTLTAAFLLAVLLSAGLVVLGIKGPAFVEQDLKDFRPWAIPWVRLYTQPSVILAVAFGAITMAFLASDLPVVSSLLSPSASESVGRALVAAITAMGMGFGYFGIVLLLQWLLLRPSHEGMPSAKSD